MAATGRGVKFRIAPLSRRYALEIMDEIRGSRMLEVFRRQPAEEKEIPIGQMAKTLFLYS
jgi:hypothetical protein